MKKTYTKPYLAVESFQLDAAIASSCSSSGYASLGYSINSCTLSDDKGTYAPTLHIIGLACAAEGIDVINIEGDPNDGYCYHGPIYNDMFMNS